MTINEPSSGAFRFLINDMNVTDRKKIDIFWKKRTKIKDPRVATHFRRDDTHLYDLKLIRKYIKPTSKILDLACGTCYITNELVEEVKYIKAVDKFSGFLKYCKKVNNLETVENDLLEFKDKKKYDIILLIGIMMFFNDQETKKIYRNCSRLLSDGGVVIIRQQFGVKDDVIINKFSKDIGSQYFSYYRNLKKEAGILKNFFNVKVIDIFPKKMNAWANTHHYALVCKKK